MHSALVAEVGLFTIWISPPSERETNQLYCRGNVYRWSPLGLCVVFAKSMERTFILIPSSRVNRFKSNANEGPSIYYVQRYSMMSGVFDSGDFV